MKTIKLTKNLETLVDDEDYLKFNQFKWYSSGNKDNIYAVRDIQENGKKKTLRLHRLILNLQDKNLVIDHINGNRLDNRKCNLRICSQSENTKNQKIKITNTSSFKGVSYRKDKKLWRARIMCDYKEIHIGYFKTKEEAAIAYNKNAIKYHGEFAVLNEV